MTDIAQKLSTARKHKGFTQEELAERAQVNLRTIQRIERAETEPRPKTLHLICQALELETDALQETPLPVPSTVKPLAARVVEGLFLLALNLTLMGITGFLVLDSEANTNSVLAAHLLSVFIPFFIVFLTPKMSGLMRMLKFGSGYVLYFCLAFGIHGFVYGFVSGLFSCLLLGVGVLYFGGVLSARLA